MHKKQQSRLYVLKWLRNSTSLNVAACWGGSTEHRDAMQPDRLVRKEDSVAGTELDPLMFAAERRALSELLSIMDNGHHSLHSTISRQRSAFSGQLLSLYCSTDKLRKSFVPKARQLFSSSPSQ